MNIGIYAGTFDPLTFGHLWVIKTARKIFDEFYVLVGTPSFKSPLLTKEERLFTLTEHFKKPESIFEQTTAGFAPADYWEPKFKIDVLPYDIETYVSECKLDINFNTNITLIRGIRDAKDLAYESSIANVNRGHNFETMFLVPPPELSNLSSSKVKELCKSEDWKAVEDYVPKTALMLLRTKLMGVNLIDSIDLDETELIRASFDKIKANGFVTLPQIVSKSQVEMMLDDFPYKMAVSEKYYLKKICVEAIEPTGTRFVKRSCSLGPIIVDINENMPDAGKVLVIEGKHRYLDAKRRGEFMIDAWVGEKAVTYLEQQGELIMSFDSNHTLQ